jgi:hypothetical protein
MIRAGAARAHAIPHGRPDHEPILVAKASNGIATGELWRYLRHGSGPEFDRWQVAFQSKGKLLDERWVIVALSSTGIAEYGAFGKAVLAIWKNSPIAPFQKASAGSGIFPTKS